MSIVTTTGGFFLTHLLICWSIAIADQLLFDQDVVEWVNYIQSEFCEQPSRCTPLPLNESFNTQSDSVRSDFRVSAEDLFVKPPPTPASCCRRCTCNLDCVQTDSCCPEMVNMVPKVTTRTVCMRPQLRPFSISYKFATVQYMMLKGCSASSGDMLVDVSTRFMCEHQTEYNTLDVNVPVTDINTGITYVNRYCAFCNGKTERDLQYWAPEVSCVNDSLRATTPDGIVTEIPKTDTCNLIYRVPEDLTSRVLECKEYILSCNVTGHWSEYNPLIEQACALYSSTYYGGYKNVFCFLCNTDRTIGYDDCRSHKDITGPGNIPPRVAVSFSALLRFRPKESLPVTEMPLKCRVDQVIDGYRDVCRNITCFPPREYTNGQCVGLFESVAGVRYRFYMKLVPLQELYPKDITHLPESLNMFIRNWKEMMGIPKHSAQSRVFLKTTGVRNRQGEHLSYEYFLVQIDMYIPVNNRVKSSFVDEFLSLGNNTVTVKGGFLNKHFDFHASFVMAELQMLEGQNGTHIFDEEVLLFDSIHGDILIQLNDLKDLFSEEEHEGEEDGQKIELVEVMILPKVCPLVGIPLSDLDTEWFTWGVSLKDIDTNVTKSSYVEIPDQASQNETIFVCKNLFEDINKALMLRFPRHDKRAVQQDLPQGILSLVCTCVSVFCSIMTLITYALFKELRTQPGINNIMLTLNLIIAQILFQFGAGQAQVVDWGCKVVGVLVHFFWLMAIMWMNVCSLHMFRVFKSLREKSIGSSIAKITLAYTVYCIIISCIPVAVTIAVSSTENNDLGYGGHICYISSYHMVGISFALPVGVIILTNFLFFLSVIITISKMPKIDANSSKHRNYAKIYIKLSTLTGLTWIFGFLYFFTGVEVLEYIFIILNAGIGVFIFLAFVCNQRVVKLFSLLLRPSKTRYSESTRRTSLSESPSRANGMAHP